MHYLHESLPEIPDGAVAARVEILTSTYSLHDVRIEARIVSMLGGSYPGTRIRLEPRHVTSCDSFPSAGETGIVVGYVISSSDDLLIVDPIRAPSPIRAK
jgi:hypothetical protein